MYCVIVQPNLRLTSYSRIYSYPVKPFQSSRRSYCEKAIQSVPTDGVRRWASDIYLCLLGAVRPERAGGAIAVFVHLDDHSGCAERRAQLRAGSEYPPLRLDGGIVRRAFLSDLRMFAALFAPFRLPRGDESAAHGFRTSGKAAAGLYGALRQRQAAQGDSGKHRRGGNLPRPSIARSVQRHGDAGGAAGAAVRI